MRFVCLLLLGGCSILSSSDGVGAAGAGGRGGARDAGARDAALRDGGAGVAGGAAGGGGTDSGGVWRPITPVGALAARMSAATVWTGAQVCIWGGAGQLGDFQDGAFYDPARDAWTALPSSGAPPKRNTMVSAWLAGQLVVWGGFDSLGGAIAGGARFNPLSGPTGGWLPLPGGGPSTRLGASGVASETELLVFGGLAGNTVLGDGASLRLGLSPGWSPIAPLAAPVAEARFEHSAVWTGSEMIVWGGQNQVPTTTHTGAIFDPAGGRWRSTSDRGAPLARAVHTAVWTGTEMIVWGGQNVGGDALDSGGAYSPARDEWRPVRAEGSPEPRSYTRAAWTGSEMIVWGGGLGRPIQTFFDTGARYRPDLDRWTPVTRVGAPSARAESSLSWTGSELVVWGGLGPSGFLDDGARWRPN